VRAVSSAQVNPYSTAIAPRNARSSESVVVKATEHSGVAADDGQESPRLPPPRAGQGSVHVAIQAGLVDLVALVGKAREQTQNLLIEGGPLLSSVQAHIHGGMSSASIKRGVCGRHAQSRVG
jgi:hypothetical protein